MEQENEYVKEKEVEITAITIELEKGNEEVRRIRFESDKDITWKPKIQKEEFEDGIKIQKTVQMKKDEIPTLIKDIAKKISKEGKVKIKASYSIYNTENSEGDSVSYRYITSEKTLNSWIIL